MIPSADLAKVIARHAKLVGDVSNLHLRSAGGRMAVVSGNKAGIILRSRVKYDGDLQACVDGTTLAGIIKGQGPIDLSVKDSRLHLKGSRLRADIPLVSSEFPRLPKPEDSILVSAKDVAALRQAIERVSIKEGGPDAQLSLGGDGKTLTLAYYDNYYGAFYEVPFKTKLTLGFLPQDVPLLQGALTEGDVKLSQLGMQLVVWTPEEQFLLQSTTPNVVGLETVDEGARMMAKFDLAALKLTLDSMSVLLKSKESNTITVSVGDGITLSVNSQAGSMKKRIDAEVKEKAQFAINYRFINDIINLCDGDSARLLAYRGEDKSITRIQVRAGGVHYVAVTSV